jgi:hypothetical protein
MTHRGCVNFRKPKDCDLELESIACIRIACLRYRKRLALSHVTATCYLICLLLLLFQPPQVRLQRQQQQYPSLSFFRRRQRRFRVLARGGQRRRRRLGRVQLRLRGRGVGSDRHTCHYRWVRVSDKIMLSF